MLGEILQDHLSFLANRVSRMSTMQKKTMYRVHQDLCGTYPTEFLLHQLVDEPVVFDRGDPGNSPDDADRLHPGGRRARSLRVVLTCHTYTGGVCKVSSQWLSEHQRSDYEREKVFHHGHLLTGVI